MWRLDFRALRVTCTRFTHFGGREGDSFSQVESPKEEGKTSPAKPRTLPPTSELAGREDKIHPEAGKAEASGFLSHGAPSKALGEPWQRGYMIFCFCRIRKSL